MTKAEKLMVKEIARKVVVVQHRASLHPHPKAEIRFWRKGWPFDVWESTTQEEWQKLEKVFVALGITVEELDEDDNVI